MREAVIEGATGRALTIRRLAERPDEYEARLRTPAGTALTTIYDYKPALADYFRDLAQSWRGFDGTKSYVSLEGDLSLEATHDRLGTLELRATVSDPSPPEWSFTAVLSLGAGSNLDRIAADVEGIFTL